MNKKWLAVLAAMVAVVCMGCKGEYPSYLVVRNTKEGATVTKYKRGIPENLVIPDGIQAIGEFAFFGCTSLASVAIPGSVTEIGSNAFSCCRSLASVTIADGVTEIGYNAFAGCESLASVTIPDPTFMDRFLYIKKLKELHLGGTTTAQFLKAWENMSIRGLSDETVFYCTDGHFTLRSMPLPNHAQYLEMQGTTVVDHTGSLPLNLVIPRGVTKIYKKAFKGTFIHTVTIPGTVREIGEEAFMGCANLASVTISEGVREIGDSAFYRCKSLKNVTIPNSVTTIGGAAFYGCDSLTSVTIPKNVRYLSPTAFSGKTQLEYLGTKAQWRALDFFLSDHKRVKCSDGDFWIK